MGNGNKLAEFEMKEDKKMERKLFSMKMETYNKNIFLWMISKMESLLLITKMET